MNNSSIKWHIIVAIVLVWAGLLAGVAAFSQESGGVAVTATGRLEVMIVESSDHSVVTMEYFLQADTGPLYRLRFSADPPVGLKTGQQVTATGYLQGDVLYVDVDGITPAATGNGLLAPDSSTPTALGPAMIESGQVSAQTGMAAGSERRAIVLIVDLLDVKASARYTPEQIADAMYTGTRSVDKLYRAASLGQLGFVADSDNNGTPDIFGPFTVNDSAVQSCDYLAWAQAAETAAQAAGIDLSLYQHRIFVLPRSNDLPRCNWAGIANVGCVTYCRTWIAEGESPMVYAHELGHNLNLNHAGLDPENDGILNNPYGDASDPMSASRDWHLFNAPHVDRMQWYASYPGSIVTVTQSGSYDLHMLDAGPIEVPALSPRILKLPRPNGQGYYYLSYRQPIDYDDSLTSIYTQGVSLHWYQGGDYDNTAFIRALTDGEIFSDTAGDGIVQVTQVNHGGDHATVNIDLCISAPPRVLLLPSSLAVQPGDTGTYTISITNQDSPTCPATTFTLTYLSFPAGTITPSTLTLGGGASGTAQLQITTYSWLASDIYPIQVQAGDLDYFLPTHSSVVQSNATFIIDGFPPTAPTDLHSTVDSQGRATLTWNAASDTLSGVQGYIVYRNNIEIGRTSSLSYVDTTASPGTTNTYGVVAIDRAGNLSSSDSFLDFSLPSPPVVTITAPPNGTTFTTDQAVTFTGTAIDPEDGNLTAGLNWTSSIDGLLGRGGSVARNLSAGIHTLTARMTDSSGNTGTATLTINVIKPTTLTLNSIGAEDGWVLESGSNSGSGGSLKTNDTSNKALLFGDNSKKQQYKSMLSFDTAALPDNATITSATLRLQRGTLSGANLFTLPSALTADIRTGGFNDNAALETSDFQAPASATGVTTLSNAGANGAWSEGTLDAPGLAAVNKTGRTQFRLYFTVKSNNDGTADTLGYYSGANGTATTRPQLVVNYVVNTAPVVTIGAPADGAQFLPGTPITFSGTANDAEDGNITSRLIWTSDRDGVIGRGGSFSTATLSAGIHTITAAITDGFGAQRTASMTLINSSNHRPTVTIASPGPDARIAAGQTINFTGTANDPEDGNLTPRLTWTSSIDGALGTGGSFSKTLSVGIHTLQAQATDSGGFTGTTTITVTVANPVTVTFTSIGTEDGWILESTADSNSGGSIKAGDTSNKGLLLGDSSKNQQYKSIVSFDTSSLPDNAVVTGATLRLQRGTLSGTSPFATHGALLADIMTGTFNGNAALETADFQAPDGVTGVASLSNATANGTWSEGALDIQGLAALNRGGRTQFRLYFSLGDNSDAGADYLGYYAGEYSTATSRPQLVVTYY
ncbi:MAG: DNRLRE domain-containing protein [Candidatus Competibacteraceae bacterium]